MKRPYGIRGEGRTGCILWLTFAALVIYGVYKIVPVKIAAGKFSDAMQEQATFAATHGNPQIYNELLERAKELELPIARDQLVVTRTRESIEIDADYEVVIEFFGGLFKYTMPFHQAIARPLVQG